MKTLVTDPFADDAISILEWGYGPNAKQLFIQYHTVDQQRAGQAFMNVLSCMDVQAYISISGSLVDPFFRDTKLPAAIDKLTSK